MLSCVVCSVLVTSLAAAIRLVMLQHHSNPFLGTTPRRLLCVIHLHIMIMFRTCIRTILFACMAGLGNPEVLFEAGLGQVLVLLVQPKWKKLLGAMRVITRPLHHAGPAAVPSALGDLLMSWLRCKY
jgi:hypothetical protein